MSARTLQAIIKPLKAQSRLKVAKAPFVSRALKTFALRESVEAELETYLAEMRRNIPDLLPTKRWFDGAWVHGLEADLTDGTIRKGRPYAAYTRLEFALAVHPATDEVELTCRSTVFDRDLETTRVRARADAPELMAFVEEACCHFAERFWDRRRAA